jgi:hypothetical protein
MSGSLSSSGPSISSLLYTFLLAKELLWLQLALSGGGGWFSWASTNRQLRTTSVLVPWQSIISGPSAFNTGAALASPTTPTSKPAAAAGGGKLLAPSRNEGPISVSKS